MLVIIAMVLYGLYYQSMIELPVAVLAILPCRSVLIYAIFFILALVIKFRKTLFIKWGGTEEEYGAYASSNRSSLEISIVSTIIIFVVSACDLALLLINPYFLLYGIGFNIYMAAIMPFVMLLSYTRKVKKEYY